jgi:hypothetical protein
MTLLDTIIKHMEDNGLESANGINLCQLIIDEDVEVLDCYKDLIHSYKDMKKAAINQKEDERL